jgi:hypothetical protein
MLIMANAASGIVPFSHSLANLDLKRKRLQTTESFPPYMPSCKYIHSPLTGLGQKDKECWQHSQPELKGTQFFLMNRCIFIKFC